MKQKSLDNLEYDENMWARKETYEYWYEDNYMSKSDSLRVHGYSLLQELLVMSLLCPCIAHLLKCKPHN